MISAKDWILHNKMNTKCAIKKAEFRELFGNWLKEYHYDSKEQYLLISKSIQSSQLVNEMEIAECIIHEIAQYSIGIVLDCKNKHCDDKIIILSQDYENGYIDSIQNQYYKPDKQNCEYYCSECMKVKIGKT